VSNEEAAVQTRQICSECGQVFDGDQCWVCVAREEDIKETLSLSFPVALGGITVGNILAITLYPPLESNFPMVYMFPAVSFVVLVVLAFALQDQIVRYAAVVRVLIVLVAATCLMPAAYYFLNGILDGNPSVEVPSRVTSKNVSQGKYGGPDLVVSLSWNQQTIDQVFRVGHKTYSAVEPGDSVRIVVHPGAFLQPWYSDVHISDDHDHNSK